MQQTHEQDEASCREMEAGARAVGIIVLAALAGLSLVLIACVVAVVRR